MLESIGTCAPVIGHTQTHHKDTMSKNVLIVLIICVIILYYPVLLFHSQMTLYFIQFAYSIFPLSSTERTAYRQTPADGAPSLVHSWPKPPSMLVWTWSKQHFVVPVQPLFCGLLATEETIVDCDSYMDAVELLVDGIFAVVLPCFVVICCDKVPDTAISQSI